MIMRGMRPVETAAGNTPVAATGLGGRYEQHADFMGCIGATSCRLKCSNHLPQ